MNVLVFGVHDQLYALPADDVREVLRSVAVTRLPGAPAAVEGIVDVRGEVVPVLDIRERFGLPRTEIGVDEHFILTRAGGRSVLLRADRALEVRDAGVAPSADAFEGQHLAGTTRIADSLVLIYDLPTLLSASDGAILDEALRTSPEEPEA